MTKYALVCWCSGLIIILSCSSFHETVAFGSLCFYKVISDATSVIEVNDFLRHFIVYQRAVCHFHPAAPAPYRLFFLLVAFFYDGFIFHDFCRSDPLHVVRYYGKLFSIQFSLINEVFDRPISGIERQKFTIFLFGLHKDQPFTDRFLSQHEQLVS